MEVGLVKNTITIFLIMMMNVIQDYSLIIKRNIQYVRLNRKTKCTTTKVQKT